MLVFLASSRPAHARLRSLYRVLSVCLWLLLLHVAASSVHPTGFLARSSLTMVEAWSPNQRFTDGAKAIDGRKLSRIEAIGKNLFYEFTSPLENASVPAVWVHIHFGMSGAFRLYPLSKPKEPKPTTRLIISSEEAKMAAALSAMTCVHGGPELFEEKGQKLGPDPLREDADKERLWARMQLTNKPVGQVLMDQACVAGIGNIFRAEILFKSAVHPEQPASTVTREAFERIWMHSVLLLQRGFKSGSILTVDPDEAVKLGPPWTRRYIYNHSTCGRCSGRVQTWPMAARTVYCCPTCQPLLPYTTLTTKRAKAVAKAGEVVEFVSHCAAEGPETLTPQKMTVAMLVKKLQSMDMPTTGKKAVLVARLTEATQEAVSTATSITAPSPSASSPSPPPTPDTKQPSVAAPPRKQGGRSVRKAITSIKAEMDAEANVAVEQETVEVVDVRVQPGTGHLGPEASATEAEVEKKKAGEGRNVEHVALHVDGVVVDGREGVRDGRKAGESQGRKRGRPRRRASAAGTGGVGAALIDVDDEVEVKAKRVRKGSGKREWAAEVAVPGMEAGPIDELIDIS